MDNTVIILCRPEISANIGAVCRVMANTGLKNLKIIGKKEDYNAEEVVRVAIHAADIWENALFYPVGVDGLKAACSECSIVAGTSRRNGARRKGNGQKPEEFAEFMLGYAGTAGIVFGNERTGLTDDELAICSVAINIPSHKNFPSYNLSHAVLLIAYSLFTANKNKLNSQFMRHKTIPFHKIRKTAEDINDRLVKTGMFRSGGKEDNINFLSGIIARAGLTDSETEKLESIFEKLYRITQKY